MLDEEVSGMEAKEIIQQARDVLSVQRVFGEPIERDGVVVVPVAIVRGGAGGGSGEGQATSESPGGTGGGAGWGASARPAGVYVISAGDVRWQPAVDVNRIIVGGQLIAVAALLLLRSIVKARRRRA
jgi:uncharacterized spore protein YtfJ